MGTEGLLSPWVLWLLLWVQPCRGKCFVPQPGASRQQQSHWDPLSSSGVIRIPLGVGLLSRHH